MKAALLFVLLLITMSCTQAQVYKDSWAFGFGASIPRFIGTDVNGAEYNYGAHISIYANLSEHSNFRYIGKYVYMTSYSAPVKTTGISSGFDYIYQFTPCETVNPYIGLGISGLFYNLKNPTKPVISGNYLDYQANMIFGVQWGNVADWIGLGKDWRIVTELTYSTVNSDHLDGKTGPLGGLFGQNLDSYFVYDAGLMYYFETGTKSKYCDLYDGVVTLKNNENKDNNLVDYGKIADIVKQYSDKPADVDYAKIEDIVKRNSSQVISSSGVPSKGSNANNWVLLGINFNSGRTTFRPEAYPILINAAQILLTNPEIKVEIQGHTDNVGSAEANKKLSLDRAEIVKRFLVAKGVDASRLSTVGFGNTRPISDNKSTEGKAFNRRIEFKVID